MDSICVTGASLPATLEAPGYFRHSCTFHLKPRLHEVKKATRHAKFLAPCLVYPCRDYLQEVVSAPLKFWALVLHYMWDRYICTSKIGSAVPYNRQHNAKNLGCRADFFSACKWGLRRAVNAERVSLAVVQSSLLLFVTSLYTVILVRHICLTWGREFALSNLFVIKG